jgi:hypothetical protein
MWPTSFIVDAFKTETAAFSAAVEEKEERRWGQSSACSFFCAGDARRGIASIVNFYVLL